MTYTQNYQLPQWVKSDRILMDDFNDANAKIDAALKSHDDSLAGHAAQLENFGNCIFYTTVYTGTGGKGSGNRNTLTFPHTPYFVAVFGQNEGQLFLLRGAGGYAFLGTDLNYHGTAAWSGKSVSWYHDSDTRPQLNTSGKQYRVLALLAADE